MSQTHWNVLLVEDSDDDFILVRAYLNDVKAGEFTLQWACDVPDGLHQLDTYKPDILLVDYGLGRETGLDFLHKARALGCQAPAILFSNHPTYEMDLESMRAGVSEFVDKAQLSGAVLERTIRYAIERQQEQERQIMRRLKAQLELSRLLDEAHLDANALLDRLANWIGRLVGDACVVSLLSADMSRMEPVAFHHPDPAGEAMLSKILLESTYTIPIGITSRMQQTGQPVLLETVTPEQAAGLFPAAKTEYLQYFGVHSLLALPLKVGEKMIGVLWVGRSRPGSPYTLEDCLFLEGLADRAALAITNARLYEAAQKEMAERLRVEGELNEIQSRLLDGAETERLVLARDLHDGPIQDLYGVIFQMRLLRETCAMTDSAPLIDRLEEMMQRVVDNLRATSVDLRPPALAQFGLEPTIRAHCEQFIKMQPGLEIFLQMDHDNKEAKQLSERIRLILFRIYQIAMTNVVRHARAEKVWIRLHIAEEQVRMEIQDDGVGFRVPSRWVEFARQGHLGLVGANERVEAVGGEMEVISAPGKGTSIHVMLPRDR